MARLYSQTNETKNKDEKNPILDPERAGVRVAAKCTAGIGGRFHGCRQ